MSLLRTIVIGLGRKPTSLFDLRQSLSELEDLVHSAGFPVVGSMGQLVERWNPATLVGTGKLEELKEMIFNCEAQLVVVDQKLSGSQCRNLEKILGIRVLDRHQIILMIFGQRAHTYEGKLQVELAQLLDQMPRMVHAWMGSLSRLGGGIGTRGPGETALERDRRQIRRRIHMIKKKLQTVELSRAQNRKLRQRHELCCFCLVGYTNSGKSTLLNRLTGSDALVQDQLFATLDPTTRRLRLPDGSPVLVTDTVGFISQLPPQFIEAFNATLEESSAADIILHVIDHSSPYRDHQVQTVENLIRQFGWHTKPIIHVLNKMDVAPVSHPFSAGLFPRVMVSALDGSGIDSLKVKMLETLQSHSLEVELFFNRADEYRIFELHRQTQIRKKEVGSSGTFCLARMSPHLVKQWQSFLV